jgi:hypothetical protein
MKMSLNSIVTEPIWADMESRSRSEMTFFAEPLNTKGITKNEPMIKAISSFFKISPPGFFFKISQKHCYVKNFFKYFLIILHLQSLHYYNIKNENVKNFI